MRSLPAVVRAQRKIPLRLCDFARKKIKYLEEEKFKLTFTARRPIRRRGQAGLKENPFAAWRLCEKKKKLREGVEKSIGNTVEIA